MGRETKSVSNGIGNRLANYRRLANMSALKLSAATSGRITRTVISNIENGRKADVSVDELILLSLALGIPPVALALPIDEPFKEVEISYGLISTNSELMNWFQGNPGYDVYPKDDPEAKMGFPRSAATAISNEIIEGVNEYKKTAGLLERSIAIFPKSVLEEAEQKVDSLSNKLHNLGIDLKAKQIDEAND